MALIPLIDCYDLLDIDPKTLRTSLKRAGITTIPHPTDTRIKCLTTEQIELLAALHSRLLRPGSRVDNRTKTPGIPISSHEQAQEKGVASPVPALQEDISLVQKVITLETRVAHLSDQLTQLALHLLQQRDHALEHRLSTLETLLQEAVGRPTSFSPLSDPPSLAEKRQFTAKPQPVRQPHSTPARARSRMPPVVEYSPRGRYVIVSSREGEVDLTPDSPEWFSWLASLNSFRFVGKRGRLSVSRVYDRGPKQRWFAYRTIHQRDYKH